MRVNLRGLVLITVAVVMCACADPSADKPKATTGTAAPETSAAKSGETEALAITPENSKVEFDASKVTKTHHGAFKQFSGQIDLAKNVTDSKVTIDIQTGSVEVDDPELTTHLKTPDFFDIAKFPKATFTSTKIDAAAGGAANSYTVTGNLDLHGVKKSISFPATIQTNADSVAVDAEFAINRKDFGIIYAGKADDLIRDNVVLRLNLRVPRKK
ncbi:MAG TPA: YceI family protein [Pyrinomonadaceae bacterium]|nr:YceI family protein [Pyrinomonadaceae bacterium]